MPFQLSHRSPSPRSVLFRPLIIAMLLIGIPSAYASGGEIVGDNLIWLAVILLAARVFGPLAEKIGFPAVLGELVLGVVLGNLTLVGCRFFEPMSHDPIIAFLAELGVIILLLQIGLETRIEDLAKVGGRAFAVACVGVVAPFILGTYLIGPWLLPELHENNTNPNHTYLFLGAALAATSVGITGRVFRDMGRLDSSEARIVLGAAVIDDVLGLIILAVVSSLVATGTVSSGEVLFIIAKSVIFLVASIGIGRLIAPYSSAWLARLDSGHSMLFAQIMAAALLFAWLAQLAGLAPIIGAFAAGLLFEPAIFSRFETPRIVQDVQTLLPEEQKGKGGFVDRVLDTLVLHTHRQHEDIIEPIGFFFVPVFFVLTGMHVDLTTFTNPTIVLVALGVSLAAIVGKVMAGFVAGKGNNLWIVGWGMVPRGEVGLIFAMAGNRLGVLSNSIFSVIVIMVIFTTLLAPLILTALLKRQEKSRQTP